MGLGSGAGLTSGSQNVFLGVNAGATNSTNNSNVYIGFECGGVNDGDDNVALGAEAMTGSLNQNCVFLGRLSGAHAINNNGSIYIGKDAGRENDHVTNVMIGYESGYGSTRSNENVFLGTKTGRTLKTGGANTLIGDHAGFSMSTNETNNTFVGHQSGSAFDSGDNNTALGGSTVVNPGVNNSTAIGFNSTVCSSSTIVIGSNNGSRGKEAVIIGGCQPVWAGVGDFEVIGGDGYAVNWYGVSDVRLKTNIKKIENPFQIINSLNGYLYNFKTNNDLGIKLPVEQQSGLLAQEIEKVFPTAIKQNSDGYLSVNYSSLIPVLIEGLKQLEEENIKLNRRIKEIEAVDEKQDIISLNNIGRLNQNKPNPFYQETVFSYQINNEYNHAEIKIFDLSGKLKESITIPMDSLSVTYANNNLLPGIYAYTLFVDGLSVDTKTLVITD
jgi:hypothetical protein